MKTIEVKLQLPELPAGYEYTGEFRKPKPGEIASSDGKLYTDVDLINEYPIVRRTVKKYDWSLVDDRVIVIGPDGISRTMASVRDHDTSRYTIASFWQPSMMEWCPVDGGASHVTVIFMNGNSTSGRAGSFDWSAGGRMAIRAWQFNGIADDYEY